MHTCKWPMVLGAMLAGLVASMAAHSAAYVSPLVGGGGGTAYSRGCGSLGVLVGLQTKFGSWIDQITPVCQQFSANGTIDDIFTLARIGGTGGINIEEARCPAGKVLAGLVVRWGTYTNSVELRCASWTASNKTRGTSLSGGGTIGTGGGVTTTSLSCPAGQVGKGLKGKAGIYVDSMSLVCNQWNQ
jgi:hypothetical protein